MGCLEGYDVSEDDRLRIIDILSKIDSEIGGYTSGNQEKQRDITNDDEVKPLEINIEDLKQSMSSTKNEKYDKYNKVYNNAVGK